MVKDESLESAVGSSHGWIRKAAGSVASQFSDLKRYLAEDLALGSLFSAKSANELKNSVKESAKRNLAALLGYASITPFYVFAHEGLHSVAYKLMGHGIDYFGVSELAGGSVFQKMFPWVSTNLREFVDKWNLFGSVNTEPEPSRAEYASGLFAPYILTPLGIYLLQKGREKGSRFIQGIGFVMAASPFTHIHTEMKNIAYTITGWESPVLNTAIGAVIAAGTYAASSYIVGKVRGLFRKKQEKEAVHPPAGNFRSMAGYYAALAASAVLIGYAGKPTLPIMHSGRELAENKDMISRLCSEQKFDELLSKGLGSRKEYADELAEAYAAMAASSFISKDRAAGMVSKEVLYKFHISLAKKLIKKGDLEGALESISNAREDNRMHEDPNMQRRNRLLATADSLVREAGETGENEEAASCLKLAASCYAAAAETMAEETDPGRKEFTMDLSRNALAMVRAASLGIKGWNRAHTNEEVNGNNRLLTSMINEKKYREMLETGLQYQNLRYLVWFPTAYARLVSEGAITEEEALADLYTNSTRENFYRVRFGEFLNSQMYDEALRTIPKICSVPGCKSNAGALMQTLYFSKGMHIESTARFLTPEKAAPVLREAIGCFEESLKCGTYNEDYSASIKKCLERAQKRLGAMQ